MAVGAPNLALGDFCDDPLQGGTRPGEVCDGCSFGSYVVEVERDDLSLAAVRAGARFEGPVYEANVATDRGLQAVQSPPPVRIRAAPPRSPPGAVAMAVCADDFALLDLRPYPIQAVPGTDECRYVRLLVTEMVELENLEIALAAVCTR